MHFNSFEIFVDRDVFSYYRVYYAFHLNLHKIVGRIVMYKNWVHINDGNEIKMNYVLYVLFEACQ